MKVLHVNTVLDSVTGGGYAERVFQMSKALSRAGHDNIILATDVALTEERKSEFHESELIILKTLVPRFFIPKLPLVKLFEVLKSVDMIHLMGHWSFLNIIVFFYAQALKKPYICSPAGALNIYGRSKWLKRLFNIIIGQRILANASGYIAVSSNELDDYEKLGIKKEKVTLIPNGITEEAYQSKDSTEFRKKCGLEDHPFLLYMGRLNYYKGPDLLLDAFLQIHTKNPQLHLVMAGPDEDMLEPMMKKVKQSGLEERVHYVGFLGGQQKSEALYGCEFVVIPSRFDAMSIVVLEAGITSKPVLMTDTAGFLEVEKGGYGKITKASVSSIAQGVQSLLDEEASHLKSLGENFNRYIVEKYHWDSIIKLFISLSETIIKSKTSAFLETQKSP